MKRTLLSIFSLSILSLNAQQVYQFDDYLPATLMDGSNELVSGFAGGMNNPQFSPIDLNQDGTMDLLVFDRDGNALMPFLTTGTGSNTHYAFAPEYISHFPKDLQHIVKLVDFNCDGKMDIFYRVLNGLGVYENTSTPGNLSFQWALGNDPYLKTTFPNGLVSNLYVLSIDMPVIDDVDGDGDIDILSFEVNGTQVYYHENVAHPGCGLDFELRQDCWGGFNEDPNNNGIVLDACIPGGAPPVEGPEDIQHAGSTLLSLDMNNDGLDELVLGDVSFPTATLAYNSGTPDSAYMGSQSNFWAPDGSTPIDLYVFPAFYYMDLTFDGVPDLVSAPNIMPSKNYNQVWMYTNNGQANNPSFSFTDSTFLQNQMIDLGEGAFPTFADLNGDGKQDIVIGNRGYWVSGGNYEPTIWYLRNTSSSGSISFEIASKSLVSFSGLNSPVSPVPAFGDLDGDFDLDMLVGLEDGTIAYFLNTGSVNSPTFSLQQANFQSIDVGNNAAPELYDIDGDGDLDLFVGEKDGNINFFKNNNGTFTLESNTFGGINVDLYGVFQGYSVPRFYDSPQREVLYVGSEDRGVLQYDSASAMVTKPSQIDHVFGSGTDTTTTAELTPFGSYKRTGRNQYLYTASELKAAGLSYGKIEKIGFYITTTNTANSLTNGVTVRMKNDTLSSLNGFITGMTEVYDYMMPMGPGWNEIILQNPFIWDGESDVVVEICFSRNLPFVDNHVLATDVGFNANAYGDYTGYNNNTSDGCTMPYLASSTLRPNTRIVFTPTTPFGGDILPVGHRTNADFADLDGDGNPEAIIGHFRGGVNLMKGVPFDSTVSNPEWIAEAEILVYPNPTDDQVFVEINENNVPFQLIDLNGRILKQGTLNRGRNEVDLSGFNPGLYLLRTDNGNQARHAKIIVY